MREMSELMPINPPWSTCHFRGPDVRGGIFSIHDAGNAPEEIITPLSNDDIAEAIVFRNADGKIYSIVELAERIGMPIAVLREEMRRAFEPIEGWGIAQLGIATLPALIEERERQMKRRAS